jgi:hypothetical protein
MLERLRSFLYLHNRELNDLQKIIRGGDDDDDDDDDNAELRILTINIIF